MVQTNSQHALLYAAKSDPWEPKKGVSGENRRGDARRENGGKPRRKRKKIDEEECSGRGEERKEGRKYEGGDEGRLRVLRGGKDTL